MAWACSRPCGHCRSAGLHWVSSPQARTLRQQCAELSSPRTRLKRHPAKTLLACGQSSLFVWSLHGDWPCDSHRPRLPGEARPGSGILPAPELRARGALWGVKSEIIPPSKIREGPVQSSPPSPVHSWAWAGHPTGLSREGTLCPLTLSCRDSGG